MGPSSAVSPRPVGGSRDGRRLQGSARQMGRFRGYLPSRWPIPGIEGRGPSLSRGCRSADADASGVVVGHRSGACGFRAVTRADAVCRADKMQRQVDRAGGVTERVFDGADQGDRVGLDRAAPRPGLLLPGHGQDSVDPDVVQRDPAVVGYLRMRKASTWIRSSSAWWRLVAAAHDPGSS